MKQLRKSNFPMYGGSGGSYVKVKEKCKKFPYCDEGDINALEFYENDELNEAVKNVSKKYGLPYPLLADEDKSVINAFGVWGPKKFMGKEYDGIHRTTFVIDAYGIIEDIIVKVKTKEHTSQILK